MPKLFIHQPVFRLLSPIFIGVMVYLLILLLNNDTSQIHLLFESQEVYVCIVASFLILEVNRFVITIFEKLENQLSEWQRPLIVGGVNGLTAVVLASLTVGFQAFRKW